MINPTTSLSQPIVPYQVGVFALVQKGNDFVLVQPHRLMLPGGPMSLPGALIPELGNEQEAVESILRPSVLQQLGIAIGELHLVGSHTIRGGELSRLPRLNLIFGTEYCSGILNPSAEYHKAAMWVPRQQLRQDVPEWLSRAIEKMPTPANIPLNPPSKGFLGWRRIAR